MKIFKVTYSEFVPCYDIEVEAENEYDATDKAQEILRETLDEEPEIWNVEEVKKKKTQEDFDNEMEKYLKDKEIDDYENFLIEEADDYNGFNKVGKKLHLTH